MAVMLSENAALLDTKKWIIDILPSERAFACKMKLEEMKQQSFSTNLTSSQLGTKLIQPILQMVDERKNRLCAYGEAVLFEKRGTGATANIFFRMVNAAWSLQ